MTPSQPVRAFHAMAKPSGSNCNLRCAYCFYLEKAALYPGAPYRPCRMDGALLEAYVRDYIASIQEEDDVAFTWQGGEPTLLGLDFYRRAVELQERYGQGRRITNSFQTNGLLLDDSWCTFLARHDFLVGLSLDGPEDIHNEYRLTAAGRPSHHLVMRALRLLRRHGVRHNVLACVNRRSSGEPLRVYQFFRDEGVEFVQFMPVVERDAGPRESAAGLRLHGPNGPEAPPGAPVDVTSWSVPPEAYGRFLTDIFDHWVRRDVGKMFVMNFEWALANFMGRPGASCHHRPTCGRSVVVEHNGDVYACDHYVYPQYRLGNLLEQSFASMLDTPDQERFGTDKYTALPRQCKQCPVLKGCWGGCPKQRFMQSDEGEPGLNYLCPSYRHFFRHIAPSMSGMAQLIAGGRPPQDIMDATLVFVDK